MNQEIVEATNAVLAWSGLNLVHFN